MREVLREANGRDVGSVLVMAAMMCSVGTSNCTGRRLLCSASDQLCAPVLPSFGLIYSRISPHVSAANRCRLCTVPRHAPTAS